MVLLEQSVQLRIQQGMTRDKALKDTNEYPTSVGLYSETKALVQIRQEHPGLRVDQLFTERIPWRERQTFLNTLPGVRRFRSTTM